MTPGAHPQGHPGVLEQLLRLRIEEMEMLLVEHDPDRRVRCGSEIGMVAGELQMMSELELEVGEISSWLDRIDATFHPAGLRLE